MLRRTQLLATCLCSRLNWITSLDTNRITISNTNTNLNHAVLQPYVDVSIGNSYTISVQASDPVEAGAKTSCKQLGPSKQYTALFDPKQVKPTMTYNVVNGATSTCDTWLHLIPDDYFAMQGSYTITVTGEEGGNPLSISEITYDKLPMMNDPSNLQYTIPLFYQVADSPPKTIYVTGWGTNDLGVGTVKGSCTLPTDGSTGDICPKKSKVAGPNLLSSFSKHMATDALFDQNYSGTAYVHGAGCVGDEYKLYRYW